MVIIKGRLNVAKKKVKRLVGWTYKKCPVGNWAFKQISVMRKDEALEMLC